MFDVSPTLVLIAASEQELKYKLLSRAGCSQGIDFVLSRVTAGWEGPVQVCRTNIPALGLALSPLRIPAAFGARA